MAKRVSPELIRRQAEELHRFTIAEDRAAEDRFQEKPEVQAAREQGIDFLIEPDPRTILDALFPLQARLHLFRVYLEAATSEQIARRVAMKNATENANEVGRGLKMAYNRARQSQITNEIAWERIKADVAYAAETRNILMLRGVGDRVEPHQERPIEPTGSNRRAGCGDAGCIGCARRAADQRPQEEGPGLHRRSGGTLALRGPAT